MRRVIHVGALNIKFENTANHNAEQYEALFNFISANKMIGAFRKPSSGLVKVSNKETFNSQDCIFGQIIRFTDISEGSQWFSLDLNDIVRDEEGNPAQLISSDFKPNTEDTYFVFFPDGHRLFYDSKKIHPNSLKKFFDSLFEKTDVRGKFGRVYTEVETDLDTVTKIIQAPNKQKLYIEFTLPNPEYLNEEKKSIIDRANRMNTKKYKEEYRTGQPYVLELDDEAKAKIDIASSNGFAYVKTIGGNGKSKMVSTKDYPLKETAIYFDDEQSFFETLVRKSFEIWQKLIRRG